MRERHRHSKDRPLAVLFCVVFMAWAVSPARAQDKAGQEPTGRTTSADVVAGLPVVPAGLNRQYALEVRPARRIAVHETCEVTTPNMRASQWLLVMAVPPALPCQRISNFRTIPPTRELEDYSPLRRKLRIGRTLVQSPELRQAARCEIDFEVQPFARRLLSRDPGTPESDVAPLGEKERVLALQPTEIFDYPSPAFVGWMDSRRLTRGEAEGEVDYARRVFLEIVTTYTFEFGTEETLAASALCEEKESACSGLCVLFVAVLRSQGIPARVLAGLNAKTNPPQPRSGRARHAKAEFFAQGVGWVPLDPAAAIRYDKTPERRRFFGNDRGDMITVHLDTEITFQVFEGQRRTRRFLVNPYFRAAGKGNHQDMTHEDSWTVTPMKDGS